MVIYFEEKQLIYETATQVETATRRHLFDLINAKKTLLNNMSHPQIDEYPLSKAWANSSFSDKKKDILRIFKKEIKDILLKYDQVEVKL